VHILKTNNYIVHQSLCECLSVVGMQSVTSYSFDAQCKSGTCRNMYDGRVSLILQA